MEFEKYLLWYVFAVCVILFGNIFKDGRGFYNKLILPSFAPKPIVYGIVWTLLYFSNATGCCLLQNNNGGNWSFELTLYLVFLAVSSLFSPAFFKLNNLGLSLIIMLLSTALIVVTTIFFFVKYAVAGWFVFPTAIWVGFATILMFVIYLNNSQCDPIPTTCKSNKNQQQTGYTITTFDF